MKRILIGLFCILSCLDAKVYYSTGQRRISYRIPRKLRSLRFGQTPSGQEEVVSSHVTSKHDLLDAFNRLIQVGYGTRLQRWVKYLWRDKTEEEHAQENLEKELKDIKKNKRLDHFIESVQELQKALGQMLDKMESDVVYNPSIIFHDDGSVTVNDKKYTFAETVFADTQKGVEKLEAQIGPRLIAAAKENLMKDPISYFIGGTEIESILEELKKVLDMPGKEVKTLLEGIFSEKSIDKKVLLKLHPDRNAQRKDDADTAFKNYNTVKAAFKDDKQKFDRACAQL